MDPELTLKERRFVECYLGEARGCASLAARMAGYKNDHPTGSRLLRKPTVRAAIASELDDAAMSAKECLARLSDVARGDLTDFLDLSGDGPPVVDIRKARKRGRSHLLKRLAVGKDGVRLELHDPLAALALLARFHRLTVDAREEPVDMGKALERAHEIVARRRAERNESPTHEPR